ncbi:MAG: hypothetical protein J2P14_09560 [Acidothermales bacterium]|nr:hypothetical protein [Acidothermales bacterium]
MNRTARYLAIGFALGVVATRRLGRRGRRNRRQATLRRAAFELATLAFAVREIATELDAFESRRLIGSRGADAVGDAGDRRALVAASRVDQGNEAGR